MTCFTSRFGPSILKLLAVVGISIFVAYFVISFPAGGGRQYDEYSSPMAAMWTGIGAMWYSINFLLWWGSSKNLVTRKTDTRDGLWTLYIWVLYSLLFAIEGFVAVIGWAQAKSEATTSVLSILWVLVGGVTTSMAFSLVRAKRSGDGRASSKQETAPDVEDGTFQDDHNQQVSKPKKSCCNWCCCCCTKRFWVDLTFLFLATLLFLFSTGFMMQATASASDAKMVPPGTIYSFPITLEDGVTTMDLEMHLYCFGTKTNATTTSPTIILEHGGGANSMTMLALAQALQTNYQTRACVYDRLGYGYTPSFYTNTGNNNNNRLPNTGAILSKLLETAGEQGPYICAGHSAGGEACLWFAYEQQQGQVTGVAMMDGYPDIIRAGSYRPGIPPEGTGPLPNIQAVAVLAAGTGLTRGLVGNQGPDFVPTSQHATVKSLYGQARFWFCQYWDVRSDIEAPEESRLYQQLNGSLGENGIVTYGGTLSGTKVLVLPAESTTADLDCDGKDQDAHCCGHAKNSTPCQNQALDRTIFRAQNELYATTLSNDTAGLVIPGPAGSEHGFVNHKDYYQWIATQIGEQLLM